MKANEVPEKIYLKRTPYTIIDGWGDTKLTLPEGMEQIEYIRKDAFIEKACEYLKCLRHYNEGFIYPSHIRTIDNFVEGFKKYMEE